MVENSWTILPLRLAKLATDAPCRSLTTPESLDGLLEEAVGIVGGLSAAGHHPECDQLDVTCATRHLAELRHRAVALWWQWREQAEEDAEENDASEHRAGRGRQPPSSQ